MALASMGEQIVALASSQRGKSEHLKAACRGLTTETGFTSVRPWKVSQKTDYRRGLLDGKGEKAG